MKQVTVEPQKSSTLLPPHIIKATGASRAKSDSQVCRTQRVSRRVLWPDDCLSPQRLVCTLPCLRGPPCLTAPLPLGRTAVHVLVYCVWCGVRICRVLSCLPISRVLSPSECGVICLHLGCHACMVWCVHLCGVCICVVPDPLACRYGVMCASVWCPTQDPNPSHSHQ